MRVQTMMVGLLQAALLMACERTATDSQNNKSLDRAARTAKLRPGPSSNARPAPGR